METSITTQYDNESVLNGANKVYVVIQLHQLGEQTRKNNKKVTIPAKLY